MIKILIWGVIKASMRIPFSFFKISGLIWASPCSLLGLMLCLTARPFGARMRWADGAWECCLPCDGLAAKWLEGRQPFVAITLGHVIFALRAQDLANWHAHERVHVRQFEAWGPLMLLAYPAASAWAWLRGQDAYVGNCFERQAYRVGCDAKHS